jgi:hypothetical protein
LGEYTIYNESTIGVIGPESSANVTFDTNIVPGSTDPTPEPSGGVIVLGVAFLIALGLKAHRTIKVQ